MAFKHLGQRSTAPTKELEFFPKPEGITLVKFDCYELTSFCPITEQPDFSTVIIEYAPDQWCLESKSLKLYLWSFREDRIFGEGLASQIAKDIHQAVSPYWVTVTLTQNVRGGMQLTATARLGNN
jgi:7-cyano-7-deazaguanine reductase